MMSYCLTRTERDLLIKVINEKYKHLEKFDDATFYNIINFILPTWRNEQLANHRDSTSHYSMEPYKNFCMYLKQPELFRISGAHNPDGLYGSLQEMVEHEENISYEQFCLERDINFSTNN